MSGGADGVRFTPPTPSEQHAADGPPQPQPIPEGGAEEDEEDDDEDDEVEPLGEERLGEEDDFVAGDPCDVCEGVHAAQVRPRACIGGELRSGRRGGNMKSVLLFPVSLGCASTQARCLVVVGEWTGDCIV